MCASVAVKGRTCVTKSCGGKASKSRPSGWRDSVGPCTQSEAETGGHVSHALIATEVSV